MEDLYQKIVQGFSATSGEEFLYLLCELFAKALDIDSVLLGEVAEDSPERIKIIAAYPKEMATEIQEVPCSETVWGKVLEKGVCRYPEKVRQEFPQDPLLARLEAESLLGVPLLDSGGKTLGFMAVIGRLPIRTMNRMEMVLSVFSVRAATEIERRRVTEALRISEERFQVIANYTFDWEYWLAPDGRLLWTNPSVLRITGYSPEECLNMPDFPRTLIHEEDRETDAKGCLQSFSKRTSDNNIHFRICKKNGSVLWVAASWQPIFNVEKEYLGIRASIRDISKRKEAVEKLEATNRELDAFVYTVSHDLRTPLTPIIGFSEFLRENYREQLDDKGLDILVEIEKQARRMLALMEDLLDLARIGRIERSAEPIDAFEVLNDVLFDLGSLIASSGHSVKKEELPATHVPKSLLYQVFENLIGNALRYAGPMGGPIEVGGERQGRRVRYFVRDHGRGIPPAERDRIFEAFFRGDSGKKSMGTGIGLATVQKIARLYGGEAWMEETPGGGCTFWFETMVDASEVL
ncbi:ATP-binding protein [Desulfuromonas sp. TF]|uniref:sensor histidine kinase n=1 Tax=Desulfuromonas sp. TF TaxID=1232410 RepID=UPI0003F8A1B8|nr:ATP-binding protein [Desulfuromonas sp. TF]